MIRSVFAPLIFIALTGCTSSGLYNWGDYEDNLFVYYHKPALQNQVMAEHIAFLAKLEQENQRPAPGLLAEAGTLLLLQGKTREAIEYYQKEYDVWPESRPMMSALINNLKERK